MRFLKHALLLAAFSLAFISCGDDDDDYLNDPPLEPPFITGASFTSADYILTTTHKSYYNPFFIEEASGYKNYAYGLRLHLKLNNSAYLNVIEHLKLYAPDGANALYYEFDKYQLHDMYDSSSGGYILVIDSLYYTGDAPGNQDFYPAKEYDWTIWIYDAAGFFAPAFTTQTKTDSYIYNDTVWASRPDSSRLKISFTEASSLTASRQVKLFLFDWQKKYVKDYPLAAIDDFSEAFFTDVPDAAAFYRVIISDVYNGIKRTYAGKFEGLPAR